MKEPPPGSVLRNRRLLRERIRGGILVGMATTLACVPVAFVLKLSTAQVVAIIAGASVLGFLIPAFAILVEVFLAMFVG